MNNNRTENVVGRGASMALGLVAAKHGLKITGRFPSGVENFTGGVRHIAGKATQLVNRTLEVFKSFRSRG